MARIALVTGGASGMGLATARLFAKAGLSVAIADLTIGASEAAAEALEGAGHRGFALDVAAEHQVVDTVRHIEEDMGPIAVLATFAGISGFPKGGSRVDLRELALEDWERVMAVNARGTFLCIREMLRWRHRKPVADGRIITVSSMAAQNGGKNAGAGYVASKSAILGLTKIVAQEVAALGITVNTIAPGVIDTPMLRSVMPREKDAAYVVNVPVGRLGTPEEVAAMAAFLATPEAGFITGACIDVNGGMRMQ